MLPLDIGRQLGDTASKMSLRGVQRRLICLSWLEKRRPEPSLELARQLRNHDCPPCMRSSPKRPAPASRLGCVARLSDWVRHHDLAPDMLRVVNDLLRHKGLLLKAGTVDATLISAPSSTKNASGERDPEMHQTKKGNQWYFGMKAHIGVDAESGLVHSVATTAANVNDVTQAHKLLHGQETNVLADAGYQGAGKRNPHIEVNWLIAMRPGKRRALDLSHPLAVMIDEVERIKASIRAKVEHPFRVIKRQFGYTKVRYRGRAKNTAQITTLFALSNLWMARHKLLADTA